MPKSRNCKGVIPLSTLDQRVLEHHEVLHDPIARERARPRMLRAALNRRSDLAVWINRRLHALDQPRVLDELANEVGLLLPPVIAGPARPGVYQEHEAAPSARGREEPADDAPRRGTSPAERKPARAKRATSAPSNVAVV